MIIGIGTDILQIERLQAAYDRTNGRLAEKILGPEAIESKPIFGEEFFF